MKQTDAYKETEMNELKVRIPWEKSKDQVWNELFEKATSQPVLPKKAKIVPFLRYGAAAAVALLVVSVSFAYLYRTQVTTPLASHLEIELPDGSKVLLNAESKIAYKPYWWAIERKVELAGEAYFKVQKGEKFTVESASGSTSVLGTSFNIYARTDEYEVTCLTGKVRVQSKGGDQKVVLTPNSKAVIRSGELVRQEVLATQSIAWSRQEFCFTSVPLSKVFEEIGRQYGVEIELEGNYNELYTGNFSKKLSLNEVLDLVCIPFDVNFTASNSNKYTIHR